MTSTDPDRVLAQRMLETRERGYTFGLFYRRNLGRYAILLGATALTLGGLAVLRLWLFVWFIAGMVLGALLRDVGWVRSARRTWPFSERVTDWGRIAALASPAGDESRPQPPSH